MQMNLFLQLISVLISVIGLTILILKLYWKTQIDIKVLDERSEQRNRSWDIRFMELENKLNIHKADNRNEFEQFIKQNNEDHREVKQGIQNITNILINAKDKF
jgi:hypothetical protein